MKSKSSETVLRGHPDKLADQIADAILDAHLQKDKEAKVACEVMLKGNNVILGGEISSSTKVDYESIIRTLLKDVGYTNSSWGIDSETCKIHTFFTEQSKELNHCLKKNDRLQPGDQSIVYGYATDETKEFLPLSYVLAQKLAVSFSLEKPFPFLRPDGKVLCIVNYEKNLPKKINCIVITLQHDESISNKALRKDVLEYIEPLVSNFCDSHTKYYINETGSFLIGGPLADAGITGRKLMVDTYGSISQHGGGAFSGKDPTKIDRYGAYAARFIAKNIVAKKITPKCSVQLVYIKGKEDPIEINLTTETSCDIDKLKKDIRKNYPLRPNDIISAFSLKNPIYQELAFGGHFGRNHPWEKLL